MSLRNSLYYIVKNNEAGVENNEAEYTIRFDTSHPVFAGHFPGHPIVPGACLVQIAEELLSAHLGQNIRFTAVRNLKFRQPVTPDQEVTLTLLLKEPTLNSLYLQIVPQGKEFSILNSTSASFTATYMCLDSDL